MGETMTNTPDPDSATADSFGSTGLITEFRGPYADGPPAAALEVTYPDIDRFGHREFFRMIYTSTLLVLGVLRGLLRKALHFRKESTAFYISEGLVEAFFRAGPTFVKIGQIIASSGLFPDDVARPAMRCLQQVPPFPFDLVRETVRDDLGHDPNQLFRRVDERALSAASVGQVHAVQLPDGTEAVIKILRPGILDSMNRDLRITYVFAKGLMKTKLGRRANATGMIRDLHRVTNQELNTSLEAFRQDEFRRNLHHFGDNKMVTAPRVLWNYCGPHMICMERVYGVPMDDFESHKRMGFEAAANLRRGMKAWVEAMAIHGPFHGDLHAGNIWALEDGRACFLDFGIMGEFEPEWQQMVRDILYTFMVDHDFARIVRGYKKLGILDSSVGDDETLGQMLSMAFEPIMNTRMEDLHFSELFQQSLEIAEQMGEMTAPEELSLLGKQFLYFERYVKGIAPDYMLVQDPYIIKNIFPEEAARKMAELAEAEPDMLVDPDADF
jgi:predicted unusual protein kinase regulating ubiquinone biosynthesis (AarF/ABC1/UbiB family)